MLRVAKGTTRGELEKAHRAAVQMLAEVGEFRRFVAAFRGGVRPPPKAFAAIDEHVANLRTALAETQKDLEPALVHFARVREPDDSVEAHGFVASSAHKVLLSAVEEMLREPWTEPGFVEAFEAAADRKTGLVNRKSHDRVLCNTHQMFLNVDGGTREDAQLLALLEIEFARALPMWRQPSDSSALTALQWSVLDLLEEPPEAKMTEQVISHRIGRHSGYGQVKGALSDLRKRGLVDNERGRGYFRVEA